MARAKDIIERLNDVAGRLVSEGSDDAEVVCEAVRVLRASDQLLRRAVEQLGEGRLTLRNVRAQFTRITCQHCGGDATSTKPFCGMCGKPLAKPAEAS